MSLKFPFLKFYPNDWLSDQGLRMCSLAARGVWIDLLCVMWKSTRRGYLESTKGVPISPEQLARIIGERIEIVIALIAELEAAAVFSREDGTGVIFSRRIVKDIEFLSACSEAGRKGGGNPTFKGTAKGTSKEEINGGDKGRPKPQKFRSSEVQISIAAIAASETASATGRKARARDPLLDALVALNGADPRQVTGPKWGEAGKALSVIKVVCPDVTVEEIQRRAANYHQNMPPGARISPSALAKHWADSDRGGPPTTAPARHPRDIYTEPPNWRDKAIAKWPGVPIPEKWFDLAVELRNDLLA